MTLALCEVFSNRSASRAMPIYARERVSPVWLVNPLERMVEVFRLDGDGYRLASQCGKPGPRTAT
ncbi:MAG: hypothetical protein WDO74_15005 [Pseudomonadota bacterium]